MGVSGKPYEDARQAWESILTMPHRITFTHGDLSSSNILVEDGHISAILDWETAGWLPEYWEFTTMLRYRFDDWWLAFAKDVVQDRYQAEYVADSALWELTINAV
jgi:aminoglycoside phosphotransferase (APT) family kinase protein